MWAFAIVASSCVASAAIADVVLTYHVSSTAASVASPFKFVNGANYASANAEGFVTNTYTNAADVGVTVGVTGGDGVYGTYVLDIFELQPTVTSANTWVYNLAVQTAFVGTGVNAFWVFYCSEAPTGVTVTGAPLASGTDANGNPWAIFAPTCAGTQQSLSLTAVGTGAGITIADTTSGTSILFLSFGLAVTNTGATTTTAASLVLEATSP